MKRNIYKLFIIFPFLDLITALLTRNFNLTITPGLIVKGLFMVLMFFYVFFSKSKYKKITITSFLLFLIYICCYFIYKPDLLIINHFTNEMNYLFKLLYFPVIFLSLLCFYDEFKFNKKDIIKIMKINLISMSLLLIIPLLLNCAYSTYPSNLKGYIGWFYAGNEIANIMILLFPSIYYFINEKYKYHFLISLPIIYIILLIGTKVSLIGVLVLTIINLLYAFFKEKKLRSYIYISNILIMIIVLIFSYNSYAVYNYKYSLNNYVEPDKIIIDENEVDEVNNIINNINKFYNHNNFNEIFKSLLSGRDIYLANTLSIYNNELTDSNIWLGIGFSNTDKVNNTNITKLIEIDILDAYFHYGIIGLLIMFSPFILISYYLIKSKKRINLNSIYYSLILLLGFAISCFSGHVYTAPSVSIYLILYLLLLSNEFKLMGRNNDLINKISILSLHLGYGGIEKSIINQANMLSEKFEVEIIVLYKLKNECDYNINKNIKIIYLSDLEPNKKEFIESLNQKNIFKIFSEGFKSLCILYKKIKYISKYIYDSDSKIIISTRLEFTKLLNKYGNKNSIKIAEEHVFHNNNKKYIKKLCKSLTNIDFLIPASKYLTKDYKKYFRNLNTKIVYIPQTIDYLPETLNNIKNKNLLFVGRLEPEKGLIDLIEIFKKINEKNKDIKLTIVGDGSQKKIIKDLIDKYNLNNYIIMTGYLSGNDLKQEFENASLFIMTSHEESFGLVLIEAMSYGIPCIAFDSALGAKEIISGKNGIIIKNRDKKAMSIEIINYFKKLSHKTIQKEAINTAINYSFDKIQKEWEKFISKILNNK